MGILAVQLLAVWTLLSTSSEFSRILLNHTPTIYQPYINHISTMDSEWTHPYPSQPRLHVDRADDLQPHKDTFFVSFWVPELKIPKWFNSYLSIYAAYDHIWSYMYQVFLWNHIHENPIFSVHSKHLCCIQLIPGSWRAFREAKKDTAAQTASTKPTSVGTHGDPLAIHLQVAYWKAAKMWTYPLVNVDDITKWKDPPCYFHGNINENINELNCHFQ